MNLKKNHHGAQCNVVIFGFLVLALFWLIFAPLTKAQNANSPTNQRNLTQGARKIDFAGVTWTVKNGFGGPGPNNWSDSGESVWVDSLGRMHMKIRRINGAWHSAEVYTDNMTTYGEHRFLLEGDVTTMDRSVVLGLFVYADDRNEVDIEFSKWGFAGSTRVGGYTVQPYTTSGNTMKFSAQLDSTLFSTHFFDWQPDSVVFGSMQGHHTGAPPADSLYIHRWNYQGNDSPDTRRRLKTRINLWLFRGAAPVDTANLEMIITDVIQPMNPTGVTDRRDLAPRQFMLHQNYPNPFNPETTIRFSLDAPGIVTLKVYDIQGREVAGLLDDAVLGVGGHHAVFDAMQSKQGARPASSGIYFYTLTVRRPSTNRIVFRQAKKMLFVK